MENSYDKLNDIREEVGKEEIALFLVILLPLVLTVLFTIIGEIDACETRARLSAGPAVTWREFLNSEERKGFGGLDGDYSVIDCNDITGIHAD